MVVLDHVAEHDEHGEGEEPRHHLPRVDRHCVRAAKAAGCGVGVGAETGGRRALEWSEPGGGGGEEGEKRVILNLPWVEGRIIH